MPDTPSASAPGLTGETQTSPVQLTAVQARDADELFPLIYHSPVTDTIVWDGPISLEEFRADLAAGEEQVRRGERHLFTLRSVPGDIAIGSASIRPDAEQVRADMGLWIGGPFQGKGYGSRVVRELVKYGFEHLKLEKIDAYVFTGNWASRRIFEKNGFSLEETIRSALQKREQSVDEWLFGLTRQEYFFWRDHIVHLCARLDWESAQTTGSYQPDSLHREGFIHCSRPEQVLDVANRFYRGVSDLVLLWIEIRKLSSEVRWESTDGDDFPHVYGGIDCAAVNHAASFYPDEDGFYRSFPHLG